MDEQVSDICLFVWLRTIDFQVPNKVDYQTLVPNLIKYHKSLNNTKDDGAYTFNGGHQLSVIIQVACFGGRSLGRGCGVVGSEEAPRLRVQIMWLVSIRVVLFCFVYL